MGLFAILPFLVATFLILGQATTGSDNFEVLTTRHVSVRRGHTITLPCWLAPAQSAEALEVLWYYKNNFDYPLLRYKDREVSSSPSYSGRVSFGYHDAASSGLATGDVSLELVNVTLQDSGEYTCYVTSDQNYDRATVTLALTEIGGPVHLTAVWTDSDVVNVSCWSSGWYPQPYLRWSDPKGALTPEIVQHGEESLGLLSVHSWVLVRSSSEISCTVGIQAGEETESRLYLSKETQRHSDDSTSATAALAALVVLLLILTIVLGITFYKIRGKKLKSQSDKVEGPEEHTLLPKDMSMTDMSIVKQNYVNVSISIPENRQRFLMMKKNENNYVVRDRLGLADGSKVSCLTAFTGTPGFSSGEHYWEVFVGSEQLALKMSWWLGVTRVCDIPVNGDFFPTASKGYWFLSSSRENPDFFQLSTEPAALLPVTSRPQTVGVYLNCETGEVTFYNVQKSSVIGSLKVDFKGELFPFFNPGLYDEEPLTILLCNTPTTSDPSDEETVTLDPEKQ